MSLLSGIDYFHYFTTSSSTAVLPHWLQKRDATGVNLAYAFPTIHQMYILGGSMADPNSRAAYSSDL
jgi:hypothetical protein